MKKKTYCYLIERKSDGQKFCTFGNFKEGWNRPSALFKFVTDEHEYGIPSPFGMRNNISCDLYYNSVDYRVVRQIAV